MFQCEILKINHEKLMSDFKILINPFLLILNLNFCEIYNNLKIIKFFLNIHMIQKCALKILVL